MLFRLKLLRPTRLTIWLAALSLSLHTSCVSVLLSSLCSVGVSTRICWLGTWSCTSSPCTCLRNREDNTRQSCTEPCLWHHSIVYYLLEINFTKFVSVIVEEINYVNIVSWFSRIFVALITFRDCVASVASRSRQLLHNIFGEFILVMRSNIASRIAWNDLCELCKQYENMMAFPKNEKMSSVHVLLWQQYTLSAVRDVHGESVTLQ